MDRPIVYFGQVPRSLDILSLGQDTMVALAKLSEAILGTATVVAGFACTVTGTPSLNLVVGPGQIYELENLEATTDSGLAVDTHQILKQGVTLDPTTLTLTPPSTIGFAVNILIEATYADIDTGLVLLTFQDPANPGHTFQGPGGNGQQSNTVRKGGITIQPKYGTAATSGSQTTPTPDAGFVGIAVITLAYGATSLSSGNISAYANAPFIPTTLPGVPANIQNGSWISADDTGTANAIIIAPSAPVVAYQKYQKFRIKTAAAPTGPTTVANGSLSTRALTRSSGAALTGGEWAAGDIIEIVDDGSKYRLVGITDSGLPAAIAPLIHTKLTANLNVYVNSSTGSDSNGGLTTGTAFATLQKASDYIQKTYDLSGYTATINVAAGTSYTAGVSVYGLYTGAAGANGVTYSFGSGCSISVTNSSCFAAQQSAAYTIVGNGVVLTATGTGGGQGCGMFVNSASEIDHSGCNFGACAVAHLSINHASSMAVLGNYTVSGSAPSHISVAPFGYINYGSCSVSYGGGAYNFSTAFVNVVGGYANCQGMTGTGTGAITGQRYSADQWGTIVTGGGGANFFPGSTSGGVTASGLYR